MVGLWLPRRTSTDEWTRGDGYWSEGLRSPWSHQDRCPTDPPTSLYLSISLRSYGCVQVPPLVTTTTTKREQLPSKPSAHREWGSRVKLGPRVLHGDSVTGRPLSVCSDLNSGLSELKLRFERIIDTLNLVLVNWGPRRQTRRYFGGDTQSTLLLYSTVSFVWTVKIRNFSWDMSTDRTEDLFIRLGGPKLGSGGVPKGVLF